MQESFEEDLSWDAATARAAELIAHLNELADQAGDEAVARLEQKRQSTSGKIKNSAPQLNAA